MLRHAWLACGLFLEAFGIRCWAGCGGVSLVPMLWYARVSDMGGFVMRGAYQRMHSQTRFCNQIFILSISYRTTTRKRRSFQGEAKEQTRKRKVPGYWKDKSHLMQAIENAEKNLNILEVLVKFLSSMAEHVRILSQEIGTL